MATPREEIEEILVDCHDEDEQMMGWENAFSEGVTVPFQASLMGIPVEVQEFRVNDARALQCLAVRKEVNRQRWIGVEDLDDDPLPDDFRHDLSLFQAWVMGEY